MTVRIFTDSLHYQHPFREELIDVLKPFVGKQEGYTDADRARDYGFQINEIRMVTDLQECDWAVLPMSWNFYHIQRRLKEALAFVEAAQKAEKRVLSWVSGDFGVPVPAYPHLNVIRQSGYRSKLPAFHCGMPVFFSDPLADARVIVREKQEIPVFGFCGQAQGNWLKYAGDMGRTCWQNFKYHTKMDIFEPESIWPSTLLRSGLLTGIERDPRVKANFIRRRFYRAGAKTEQERLDTTAEYFQNMVQSEYILCVRGGGNFSVRLYETLAMGRIPVLVDTDCLLPLESDIPWRDHLVRVEKKDARHVVEHVCAFHRQLSSQDFRLLQVANRQLWENQLTLPAFFSKTLQTDLFY